MTDVGPNGCTCGFNGDCNCAFVPSAPETLEEVIADGIASGIDPTQRKKRKKSTSPTQRTLAECRKRGWTAQVVEHRVPRINVLRDLFGVIDLVVIVPAAPGSDSAILGIQATTTTNAAARYDKIIAEPRARQWVEAGGRLELWSWAKRGDRGKRKLWTLRVEALAASDWEAA